MKFTIELASKYFPKYMDFQEEMLEKQEDYLLEESLSIQRDDTNSLVLRDFYDIGGLSIAIASNLDYLKKYPQLLLFFDDNGHIRKEEELLKGFIPAKETNNSISNIYEQFLVYIYHKDNILNNTDLPPRLLTTKKIFIFEQAKKEAEFLIQIKQIVDDHKTKVGSKAVWERFHTTGIVNSRKRRLKSYYDFLSNVKIDENSKNAILGKLQELIKAYEDIIINLNPKYQDEKKHK